MRPIVIGAVLGAILASAGFYTATRTGMIDAGTIPAALVGCAILSLFGRVRADDGNLIATAATSAAMMAVTGGVAGPITALALADRAPSLLAIGAWAATIGLAGCALALPLRRAFVERGHLPFPSGVAMAEVLTTFTARDRGARRQLIFLGVAAALAAAFAVARDELAWIPASTSLAVGSLPPDAIGLAIGWSPLTVGTGALIGARISLSMLGGAAIAWLVIAPLLVEHHVVAAADFDSLLPWLLWPGLGLLLGGSVVALVDSARRVRAGVRAAVGTLRLDVPRLAAALVLALAVVLAGWLAFDAHPALIALALALSTVLCAAAAHATGETDNTPAGPLGALGQIVVGAVAPGGIGAPLAGGAVVNGAAMQSSTLLTAWVTGKRLGTSPRAQLVASAVGVVVGAIAVTATFAIVRDRIGFGTAAMPAPWATSWRSTAEVMQHGLSALPPHAAAALAAGLVLGAVLARFDRGPSPFALGSAFLIPPSASISIAIGGLIAWLARRREAELTAVASGAIAGEAIVGLVLAAVAL